MSINNLKRRINYAGGAQQQARMNADKLRSLKGALYHSYQAATIVLSDGRAFRGLINPNKLSMDLDSKELSIPFSDRQIYIPVGEEGFDYVIEEGTWEDMGPVELEEDSWNEMLPLSAQVLTIADSSQQLPLLDNIYIDKGEEEIGVQEGDIIKWRENGTYWLVLLRHLEETAYFRGSIYRCRHMVQLKSGSTYWAYIRGPVEQNIVWSQVSGDYFNKLNYSLLMRISANEETVSHFARFAKITIDGKPWEVQAVDRLSTPGILNIALKETYSNPIEENAEAVANKIDEPSVEDTPSYTYISGPATIYPYDVKTYTIENHIDIAGDWKVTNESRTNSVKVAAANKDSITIHVLTGKTGTFTLEYYTKYGTVATLDISIGSL